MINKFSASAKLYLLMFITAASLIGLGLYGIEDLKKMNDNTRTLYADRVICIQQLSNVRRAYSRDIRSIPENVKRHELSFAEAIKRIRQAQEIIDTNWYSYKRTNFTPEEKLLVEQTDILKNKADEANKSLITILSKQDTLAINKLVQKENPAESTPFAIKVTQLMELQVRVAKEILVNNTKLYQVTSRNFFLLILLSLAIVLPISFYIIKNVRNLIRDMVRGRDIIKESENRYRTILENASDAIYLVDNEQRFIEANDGMCKMLGYSKDELVQLKIEDIFDKEQLKNDPVDLSLIPYHSTFKQKRFIRKDGTVVEVEIHGRRLDERKWMGIARDITERNKAQELILKEKELSETIINSLPGLFYLRDASGKALRWNKNVEMVIGYTDDEIEGAVLRNFVVEEDREITRLAAEKTFSEGYSSVEVKVVTKNGEKIPYLLTGKPIIYENQLCLLGTGIDISSRIQAEESLRESEARFRGAFENASIGVALVSLKGEWLKVNQTLCELLGYNENELLQLTFQQITHPDDIESGVDFLSQTITGETDNYRVEKRYVRKDHSIVWANLNVSAIRDQNKQPLYFLAIIENITEKIESQVKFQNLVENFIVSVYIHQNGKLVYVNPRALEESGYAEEDLIGKPFEQFIYKDDLALVKKITEARENEEIDTVRYEARFVKKDGRPIWYELFGSRTVYQGAPALMGTMINIDERKKAEEEIHSLSRLYRFISHINESILKSENAVEVYAEACRIAIEIGGFRMAWVGVYNEQKDSITPVVWDGYEGGFLKAIGVEHMKVSESAIPSARAIRYRSHFYYNDIANDPDIPPSIKREMIKMGYLSGLSLPIFIDGKIVAVMVLLMSEPFFFNEGEIKLLRGMTDNITYALDKIRILELQNQSEANLRSIFDSTDVSYLLLDTQYNIISLNQQMRDVYQDNTGITLKEGDNLIDLIIPERRQSSRAIYDNVLQNKKPGAYEASFTNDGFTRYFAASVFPITVGKEVIGLCISSIDITQQKDALEKLKETNENLKKHARQLAISNAELEQFAFVASHDLQEPLRMVTSFMTQLEKKYGDVVDDKGRQYIHFAVDGAKRMRQIILDLLDFSRVGSTEDDMEDVNFNKVLDEILALYRRQIEELKATVTIENLPTLQTYKAPIRQVFQNLVGNSLKYHKANQAPIISISCKEIKNHYEFSIKDNGIGISSQYFDKIFIIFQRLHNKDEYSGTGMGLAITKKIIENLGGKIWVESEEGKGSTFYFTLPKTNKL